MKRCIAVLTRGYSDLSNYQDIIERNQSISYHLKDKTIPILIFHEGNIEETHQIHIWSKTPELNILFIDVKLDQKAFRLEKESVVIDPETYQFPIGYRHMCCFWIINFWDFVQEYDILLRIDEDCLVDFEIDPIFDKMEQESIQIITGNWGNDCYFVTKGLNAFTRNFLSQYFDIFIEQIPEKTPSGTCSISGFHLNILRKNPLLFSYIRKLDDSNKIYSNRWGDGTLWGEIIGYILDKSHGNPCKWDRSIHYFHKSHDAQINP